MGASLVPKDKPMTLSKTEARQALFAFLAALPMTVALLTMTYALAENLV